MSFIDILLRGNDKKSLRALFKTCLSWPVFFTQVMIICLLFIFPESSTGAPVSGKNNRGRYYEPVEVPAELLPGVKGKDLRNLGLYAWHENAWRPILFQADEKTP